MNGDAAIVIVPALIIGACFWLIWAVGTWAIGDAEQMGHDDAEG